MRRFVLAGMVLLFCAGGFCVPADVRDISNRDYTEAVVKALDNAKKSIFMVMYLVSFNEENKAGSVYRLVSALKSAHERGVSVKVILDYRSAEDMSEGSVSYFAYKFLKDAGINVMFDTPRVYTHNKTIVIDDDIVVAGSANWSEAALDRSNETNFIIESYELAQSILKRFSGIEVITQGTSQRLDTCPDMCRDKYCGSCIPAQHASACERGIGRCEQNEKREGDVLVPFSLIEKDAAFSQMLTNHDERSFDVFLLILAAVKADSNGKADISYEDIAKGIGMDRRDYRNMLNRTFKRLQDQYKLIKADISYGKPVEIFVLEPECSTPLKLSRQYWNFGWDRRLNFSEKFCLLINLREASNNAQWNEWMLTREQMGEKYGAAYHTISKGMQGLRRYGIIDVEYGEIDKGYLNREPSVTRFLGLYDFCEFEKELRSLEGIYGKDLADEARRYADIVFRAYDAESIKDILEFIKIYGRNKVGKAFGKISAKSVDNPKRSFRYLVGMLKG